MGILSDLSAEFLDIFTTAGRTAAQTADIFAAAALVGAGNKVGLTFSYSTTNTLAYTAGGCDVNKTWVEKNAGTIDISGVSNGTGKYICIQADGTITLENATATAATRPSDVCFSYNGGTGSYLDVGKYCYMFSSTKKIIAYFWKISTTSVYMTNLGSQLDEFGENSNGIYAKYSNGKIQIRTWGFNVGTNSTSTGEKTYTLPVGVFDYTKADVFVSPLGYKQNTDPTSRTDVNGQVTGESPKGRLTANTTFLGMVGSASGIATIIRVVYSILIEGTWF